MKESISQSLDYSRRLYGNILDWYKNADTKAQILLTLAGVFLSFLTSTAFTNKDNLGSILGLFGLETWILLSCMTVFLIATIVSALLCLRSRTAIPKEIVEHLHDIVGDRADKDRQWPETMWFFGIIAQLKDRKRFQSRLHEFTEEDELCALSSQIFLLSKNVLEKHKWVNRGFMLITLTLLAFLLSGISYVVRVNLDQVTTDCKTEITTQVTPNSRKTNKSLQENTRNAGASEQGVSNCLEHEVASKTQI